MEPTVALNNLSACVTLALGALAALHPAGAARGLGLRAESARGRAATRARLGGVLIGVAAFALILQDRIAFATLGACWLGAASARLLAVWRDEARDPATWRSVARDALLSIAALV